MNQTGGDYRIMINGFMNSAEYRRRFGPWFSVGSCALVDRRFNLEQKTITR